MKITPQTHHVVSFPNGETAAFPKTLNQDGLNTAAKATFQVLASQPLSAPYSEGARKDEAVLDAGNKDLAAGIAAGAKDLSATAESVAPTSHDVMGGVDQEGTAPGPSALYGVKSSRTGVGGKPTQSVIHTLAG